MQQWNLGFQYEITKNTLFEARLRERRQEFVASIAFNQGFDLNDANTPDHIFERFNQVIWRRRA